MVKCLRRINKLMIKNSRIIRKKTLIKPAGKRRIQRVESPGNNPDVKVVRPRIPRQAIRKTHVPKKSKRTRSTGFDWTKIKFTSIEPIWEGETVFIIGGGSSLTGFDFSLLKNKRTIAVNKAFLSHTTADVLYWSDSRVYQWYKKDIDKFKGDKYTIKPYGGIGGDVKVLKNMGKHGLELSPDGIKHGNNSGHAAMNVAYHYGVKRMILLGFDMQNVKGVSHFHDGYPVKQTRDEIYKKSMIPEFHQISEDLKKKKIEVINANPNSALPFFKKVPLDKVLYFK